MQHTVYNRGVRGLTTADLLANLDTLVFDLEPSMIFMQIGANDIGNQLPEEEFLGNYDQIMTAIQERLPNTVVNIMAYYPLNPEFQTGRGLIRYTEANEAANVKVEKMAKQHGFNFINLNEGLIDEDGNLKEEYTFDGIHPLATGYEIIFRNLTPYLSGK
jgi:lysophospholipase L1-like esterase